MNALLHRSHVVPDQVVWVIELVVCELLLLIDGQNGKEVHAIGHTHKLRFVYLNECLGSYVIVELVSLNALSLRQVPTLQH